MVDVLRYDKNNDSLMVIDEVDFIAEYVNFFGVDQVNNAIPLLQSQGKVDSIYYEYYIYYPDFKYDRVVVDNRKNVKPINMKQTYDVKKDLNITCDTLRFTNNTLTITLVENANINTKYKSIIINGIKFNREEPKVYKNTKKGD